MDRTTKVLLAAIAAGLWANAMMPLVRPAHADDADVWLGRIAVQVLQMAQDIHQVVTAGSDCKNPHLCQ